MTDQVPRAALAIVDAALARCDGAPYFVDRCMPLAEVKVVYARSIAMAQKLWNRFAVWVSKKEGLYLPTADLWLTPCEVA